MPADPTPTVRSHRALALAALALLAVITALAGCGGSSHADGTEADPATAVPAAAPLYLGATVRPSGSQATGALAAGKGLTGQANPYLQLLGALRTPGSPPLDFKHDVAPWLGAHAGLFMNSLGSVDALIGAVQGALSGSGQPAALPFSAGRADGAIVMDTSDASAARSFLANQAKRAGAHPASYRGVSYEVTSAGIAFGLVGRLAVIGSQTGLRAVIGTTQGEAALSAAPGYSKLLSSAPTEAIAHLYVNPATAKRTSGLAAVLSGGRQANISLLAASGSLAADIDTLATPGSSAGLLAPDPEAATALAGLPGDSWLAVGLGHVGTNLPADVLGLQALASLAGASPQGSASTLSLGSLVSGLAAPLQVLGASGAQARRDFRDWMGSGGVFAAGAGILELKAAIVIDSNDAARSRAAVAKLGARLHSSGDAVSSVSIPGTETAIEVHVAGLPLAIFIAAGRGADGHAKFVLGLGEASVGAALAPGSTLAAAPSRSAAASALGEGIQPSVILDFPTLLSLLEGVGLTEDPSLKQVLPYLRATSTLSAGGHVLGGGVERFRLVLGLHQPSP